MVASTPYTPSKLKLMGKIGKNSKRSSALLNPKNYGTFNTSNPCNPCNPFQVSPLPEMFGSCLYFKTLSALPNRSLPCEVCPFRARIEIRAQYHYSAYAASSRHVASPGPTPLGQCKANQNVRKKRWEVDGGSDLSLIGWTCLICLVTWWHLILILQRIFLMMSFQRSLLSWPVDPARSILIDFETNSTVVDCYCLPKDM